QDRYLRSDDAATHRFHAVEDPEEPLRAGGGSRGHGGVAGLGGLRVLDRRGVRHLRRPRDVLGNCPSSLPDPIALGIRRLPPCHGNSSRQDPISNPRSASAVPYGLANSSLLRERRRFPPKAGPRRRAMFTDKRDVASKSSPMPSPMRAEASRT